MSATVKAVFGPSYLAFCDFCQDGERHRLRGRAEVWAEQHNATHHRIDEVRELGRDALAALADPEQELADDYERNEYR